ncbi:Crp/Fnr family transcriptional regulator, partial [Pseudoalteromonas maricaloris]
MKYFRKMIEQYIPVNDDEWSSACSILERIYIKKGTTVHCAGDVFSEIWFIKSGLARSYFIDMNGKE